MKVNISADFRYGTNNNDEFKDLPYLNEEQRQFFTLFVESVANDKPLIGKNKTSWQDNQGKNIPETEFYQQHHFWHYHSRPYKTGETPECYTYNLEWNIKGLTSSAIIHYQKLSEQDITLLAYSPKHIPFPKIQDSNNPLLDRV